MTETSLARRGLWQVGAGGLALALVNDRLGPIRRVDDGPPLGVLELEVMTWACTRWREQGDPDTQRIPMSLSGLIADFGWPRDGTRRARAVAALDALTRATFALEVYEADTGEPRFLSRFGLIDSWTAGTPFLPGRVGKEGWLDLSGWLVRQLAAGHGTWLDWTILRGLDRPAAKRLYAWLEAERFRSSRTWPLDADLLASLGLSTTNLRRTRQMLTAAGSEVVAASSRYRSITIEPDPSGRRGAWLLVAERTSPKGVATS